MVAQAVDLILRCKADLTTQISNIFQVMTKPNDDLQTILKKSLATLVE